MKLFFILWIYITSATYHSQSSCFSDLNAFQMYKKGVLYMDAFFSKRSNFRDLGANSNAVQAYINTDRTYLKYGWESASGQRVELFTRQNKSNIIVYKPNRNCLYELKSQVISHNTNSNPELSKNYRCKSWRYCNSNTGVCFDFRNYNYKKNGVVGDYLLIYNKNEFDMYDSRYLFFDSAIYSNISTFDEILDNENGPWTATPPPEEDEREETQVIVVGQESTENIVIDISELEELEVEEIFDVVEEQASFPGGLLAMMEFLGKHIKYPEMARENGIQGRVYIQFVVLKDGSIKDIKMIRGIHETLDKEAVRVVKSMPKWVPGKQRGKFVNSRFTLPVKFKIQ